MKKISTIKDLLKLLGMPQKQQTDLCALTILSMANLTQKGQWKKAEANWMRIHDIIAFANKNYGTSYAENSRETFRKQALHHFRTAALIEDNAEATNSPNYRYKLTNEFLAVIRDVKPNKIQSSKVFEEFCKKHTSLTDLYASKKEMQKMPVKINNSEFSLSPGKHNLLQIKIIKEFAPRFAPDSQCLYLGDTTEKDLIKEENKLKELGFSITLHDTMPDVVLYREDKDWLYFIEAVTSVGPMSPDRVLNIQELTKNVKAGKIFVTAFLDFDTYKRFSKDLAWETEVWIADNPEHMIHLNGDKFLGPR
ncbi:MAG: restriction endonuclease [Paludibacteraceae bacterium]|nr:restriction endonuclease [Paludibacteraceae bacterium]